MPRNDTRRRPDTAATGEGRVREARPASAARPIGQDVTVSGEGRAGKGRPDTLPPDLQTLFEESFRRNEAGFRYLADR